MTSIQPAQLEQYKENGYVILKGFFSDEELSQFENTLVQVFALQALKIEAIREHLKKGCDPINYSGAEDFDQLTLLFEEFDKQAGFHAAKMAINTLGAKKFASSSKLMKLSSELLRCPQDLVVIADNTPGIIANMPQTVESSKRLLYRWHSEANAFPTRRNFLNLWFPLFRAKKENNGTMSVCKGSQHKRHWYSLHRGFDRDSRNQAGALRQLDTPPYELEEFEKVPMVCDRGDLVAFEGNLAHTSSQNETDTLSYVGVIRTFDYSKDLTLSYEMSAGWFGIEPYARPDLLLVDYES